MTGEPGSQAAAVALGSNLPSEYGGPDANLREAIRRVGKLGEVRAVSSLYDTEPVGFTEQPRFLNGALLLETKLPPLELVRALLAIERAMGRDREVSPPKGPRMIDLDLLLMGGLIVSSAELTLPHPAMAQRRFVLEPLAEIAPAMVDPVSGHTVLEMLKRIQAAEQR